MGATKEATARRPLGFSASGPPLASAGAGGRPGADEVRWRHRLLAAPDLSHEPVIGMTAYMDPPSPAKSA
jgi:hypothetical protein